MEKRVLGKESAKIGRLTHYPSAFWYALVANALFFFSLQSTFPVLPRFIADVVVNQPPDEVGGKVGLATAATVLLAVLARIPAGRLTDRWRHRPMLFVGAVCFVAAPLLYTISRGMPLLLLGRMVHGLGLGVFTTAFQALVAELAPEGRRGEALGLAGASASIAFISAPLAGDWLAANAGYVFMFSVCAAAAALSVVTVALIDAPVKQAPSSPISLESRLSDASTSAKSADLPEPARAEGLRLALAQTGVRAGVAAMAAMGIPFGVFLTFLPLLAEEQEIVGVGFVYSVYAVLVLLAQPVAGWMTDRVGRRWVIVPGLAIIGMATGLFAFGNSLIAFALSGAIFGLGNGLARGGVDPMVQDAVSPTLRGTAAALQYTSFDLWIGVGSYPIGLLAEEMGFGVAFVGAGAIAVLVDGGLLLMLHRNKAETRYV